MHQAPLRPIALLLLLAALASPALATEAQDNAAPTAWQWYYGQTEAQVSSIVASGYRIVDLEVEVGSPARFTVAFVKNTGSYAKAWWWYHGLTLNSVGALLGQNNGRLLDLEPYEVNGSIRYAVVMVSNTGADAKAWWYVVSTNLNDVSATVSANNARIVDIEEQVLLGQTWYSAVMISNTGADARSWYWWIGASSAFLSAEISSKNLRLTDLERRSDGKYDAVLVGNTEAMHWWWYLGMSEAGLNAVAAQNGARIQSIQRVDFGGTPYFYAVLHNNSNALTTRVGDILRNGTDGVSGLYLKEVNGAVRAGLQQDFAFEPASTIKTLMHVHAMKQISLGSASLAETLTVFTGLGGPGISDSCPTYTAPVAEDMSTVLTLMMQDSDNNRTMAIRDRFGVGNINATASSLGLTDTQIVHTLGCGGPPPNSLSLVDGGLLHEAVANGYLGDFRQELYDRMLTGVSQYGGNQLGQIISDEAAALGLSGFVLADFLANMEMAYKGGSYGYGNPLDYYWSVLAWARIPFISNGALTTREYVTGIFIHDGSNPTSVAATMDTASAELLRDEIRAALQTWAAVDGAWVDVGGGMPGFGSMQLVGQGSLAGGTATTTTLTQARPNSVATFVLGLSFLEAPFKGGIWGPFPDVLVAGIPTGAEGSIDLPTVWPTGLASGASVWVQWWMADPDALLGFAGSNTVRGTTP